MRNKYMTESYVWEDRYEQLRTIHAQLKLLRGQNINGIPHFAVEPTLSGDDRYDNALERIDKALYTAEIVCVNRMY